MRVTRLHSPDKLSANSTVNLSADASHYLINVLRLRVGDPVNLFNAEDGEFQASLLTTKKNAVSVAVQDQITVYTRPRLMIHLFLGISRGDRMDFAIQKSVELGVMTITPMYSEFGEVKFKQAERLARKLQHWQKIAVNAAEQSGRLDVPTVKEPIEFQESLQSGDNRTRLLFDASGDVSVGDIEVGENLALLTGPEGGFSAQELSLAADKGVNIVRLGPRILRTETAPIAALAVLQDRFGDF
ncbi:MAG: 16S rRNA (uracil(1498)-N(3))-methyltransferase [Pseudomonadales bacterium]|nr:16S rRNA (uracil(1498)-N(3))-methyltransferase [Pseudomonadales bacterium]